MRILIAAGVTPTIGGVSSHINSLCHALRAAGHEAVVVTPLGVSREFKAVRPSLWGTLAAFLRLPYGMILAYMASQAMLRVQIGKALAATSYDIIHAQDVSALNCALLVGRARGIPLVLTVHGFLAREAVSDGKVAAKSRAFRLLLKQEENAYRRASVIVAVSSHLSRHVIEHGAKPGRVFVMPNFVDLERFAARPGDRREGRQRFGVEEDEFVILCPRRLLPKYGADVLVRALPLLIRSGMRKPRALVLGLGEQAGDLLRLAEDLGVNQRLTLLGQIPNDRMPLLYNLADAVVIPSVSSEGAVEGSSVAALEAMACGRPVVASAIGGLLDIITHEVTGLLVPEGDPAALAAALLRLKNQRSFAMRLGESGAQRVHSEYSIRTAAESNVRLYSAAKDYSGGLPRGQRGLASY